MKRSTLIAIGTVGLMALAGCSTTPTPQSGDGSDGQDDQGGLSGELSFLSPWTQAQTAPMIEAYAEENPDATINVTYIAGNENAQQLLATQLAAGNAPDVFYLNPGAGSPTSVGVLGEAGYLADLTEQEWAADLEEPYRSFLSHDGAVYAYPSTIFGIGAMYNQTMLDEAGLEAPQTWSDLLAFCGDATEAGHPAFVLGAGAVWINAVIPYALASTLVDSQDPDFEAGVGTETDFTDSEWVTVLEQYGEMVEAGCFQENPTGTDGPSTWGIAGAGEVFGVVAPGALLSEVQAAAAEGAEFMMHALPATDDASETTMPVSLSSTLGVNAASESPELALDFVNWLSASEQLAMIASLQAGAVPTIASDDFEAPAAIAVVEELSSAGRTTPVPDLSWPNPEVQAALQSGAQGMLLGSSTPQQVTEAMQAAATQ
ncbi:ABC transporter substrate-binding protein [Agrococcus baldri]|uniref:ABC transporter substrate-binding protein n=1 Tax=Agrococcus baldri TaxID=153730 RepID=A0AA87R9Z3_9MICO|nr:ABC transporter substrate-binding protein [Agrococcus baldri]GEK79220.1 ABC transporter substrate-binding protein [Agrococcus baldri]